MTKRITALFIALLALPMMACADAGQSSATPPKYVEGQHYVRLAKDIPQRDLKRVEVVEVFWYGCSHCYHFEPLIKAWKAAIPEHIKFKKFPAVWRANMETHARAYYAIEALKDKAIRPRLHEAMFTALNVDRKPLNSMKQVRDFFVDQGVDAADFDKAWRSFGVGSQVAQIKHKQKAFGIRGTPEMIVAGKYRVSASMAGSQAEMLKVVDYLAAEEMAARQAAQ